MITKEKRVKFLELLGYTCEDITYIQWHDGGRSSEDWQTTHEVSIAYKVETEGIKEFKERDFHYMNHKYVIQEYILQTVYDREFEQHLYNIVYAAASKESLVLKF